MPDKMTLLFVKHTGHILAAVTRSADPTGTISAEDLARGGLLVRGFDSTRPSHQFEFEVPSRELDVLTVDLEPALLLDPRAFFVDENKKVPMPVAGGSVPLPGVQLTATQVTVTPISTPPGSTVSDDTKVWVQIIGGDLTQPLIATGTVPRGQSNVAIPLVPLRTGDYDVLTFVATLPPFVPEKGKMSIP
jgi:hypothetical protein